MVELRDSEKFTVDDRPHFGGGIGGLHQAARILGVKIAVKQGAKDTFTLKQPGLPDEEYSFDGLVELFNQVAGYEIYERGTINAGLMAASNARRKQKPAGETPSKNGTSPDVKGNEEVTRRFLISPRQFLMDDTLFALRSTVVDLSLARQTISKIVAPDEYLVVQLIDAALGLVQKKKDEYTSRLVADLVKEVFNGPGRK